MSKELKDQIDKKFWHGDSQKPRAYTVSDLIEILNELPQSMAVYPVYGEGVQVTVFNISGAPFVEIQEVEA